MKKISLNMHFYDEELAKKITEEGKKNLKNLKEEWEKQGMITDPEEIRQIALNNEKEKFHLIPTELQYIGLYPHIQQIGDFSNGKKITPIERIRKAHEEIKNSFSINLDNNSRIQELIKFNFRLKLGDGFEVKCDEENNPPDAVNNNEINIFIKWNETPSCAYDYVELIF